MKPLSRRSVTTGLAAAVTAIPAVGLAKDAEGNADELFTVKAAAAMDFEAWPKETMQECAGVAGREIASSDIIATGVRAHLLTSIWQTQPRSLRPGLFVVNS
jgi:hypothetical protein